MKTVDIKSKVTFFVVLLMFATSCDFLELESPNDLDADTFFKDAESAESALIGLYSSLQNRSYYGADYVLINEPLSGISVTGGFDNINIDELGFQAVTPSNIIVEEMWYSIYNTIANANRLIEGLDKIDDPSFDSDRRDEIEGQARTIRAMAHFDLLRYFGEHWNTASAFGVPIVQTVQKIGDVEARSSVAESYTFILDELTDALELVNQDDRDPAFINGATVHALLARVYLYKREYANAITHANAVIADGFNLLAAADYAKVFTNRQTSESIFELAFDAQNRSRFNSQTYSRPAALNTEVNFLAAKTLSDFFSDRAGDVRAGLVDFDPSNNDTSIQPNGRTQKYRGESSEDSPAYIIRLAEMYLILAEAKGRVTGLADLNALRIQRGLAALTAGDVPTDDAYRMAILDEIKAEFNFEGHYFFDLARVNEIKPGGVLDLDAFRAILPIPLREITATKGVVVQNPGYAE
ncbi:MAG: RagB/SusD family nutrient uptake outer membrane protein [Cyclobacteriaceae bacterium]|nr:RagB/SusD family nutrient uptake outer membrane protein [Cyclobacteriaceae bacterium]